MEPQITPAVAKAGEQLMPFLADKFAGKKEITDLAAEVKDTASAAAQALLAADSGRKRLRCLPAAPVSGK